MRRIGWLRPLAFLALAALALLAGCGGGDGGGERAGTELSGAGIRMTLPQGWEGRITVSPGADGVAVLHAGTVPLPDPAESTFGFAAVEAIPSGDVFIALVEMRPFVPSEAESDEVLRIDADELMPDAAPGPFPAAAGGAQRFFAREGREWALYVVVGSRADAETLLGPVNEALASLEFTAAE